MWVKAQRRCHFAPLLNFNPGLLQMKPVPLYIGLGVVFATHIWLLNEAMPESVRKYHAAGNLGAAALIAYGVSY